MKYDPKLPETIPSRPGHSETIVAGVWYGFSIQRDEANFDRAHDLAQEYAFIHLRHDAIPRPTCWTEDSFIEVEFLTVRSTYSLLGPKHNYFFRCRVCNPVEE